MAETDNNTTKCCTRCKTEKGLEQFCKDKTRADGKFPHCRQCQKINQQEQYRRNKAKRQAEAKVYYEANKESYKQRAKEWAARNPEKRKQVARSYVENNPDKRAATQREQQEKNPGYYRAHYKMRQTRKRKALSTWADLEAIEAIYRQCAFVSRFTGIKHHVDHYYPLKSDVVCGLHNQHNLRIIPATVNLSKGNSFPEKGLL